MRYFLILQKIQCHSDFFCSSLTHLWHEKANEELKPLASQKGIRLPDEADRSHQKKSKTLSELSGNDFDKSYIKEMVKDHKKDVNEFQKEATTILTEGAPERRHRNTIADSTPKYRARTTPSSGRTPAGCADSPPSVSTNVAKEGGVPPHSLLGCRGPPVPGVPAPRGPPQRGWANSPLKKITVAETDSGFSIDSRQSRRHSSSSLALRFNELGHDWIAFSRSPKIAPRLQYDCTRRTAKQRGNEYAAKESLPTQNEPERRACFQRKMSLN